MSEGTEELWYGWTAPELWRAGLLYLGKGATVLIVGFIIFMYQPKDNLLIDLLFFVLGGVEIWLGQWFFRQSRVMG